MWDGDDSSVSPKNRIRYAHKGRYVAVFHHTSRWAPKDPPAPYTRDLDKAEELLEEAGWFDHDGDGILDKEIGGTIVPFEFSVVCMNHPNAVAVCSLLKESLDQIGVVCNVKPLEFTVLQAKCREHEFQGMLGGWGTGADPDTSENVWGTDQIVIIDPASAKVTATINLTGLLPPGERRQGTDVLNGIARDPGDGSIWVTGKRWPWLYRIELVPVMNNGEIPKPQSQRARIAPL